MSDLASIMADQNTRFLVYLKRLGEQRPAGYRAAHLHVSQLPPGKKSRDNLSRAITVLGELKTRYKDGDIFLMQNTDLVFVARDVPRPNLAAACDQIQQIFMGQMGVAFTNIHGGVNEFFTLFELGQEYQRFLTWAEETAGVSKKESQVETKVAADMATLVRVKDELQRIDISTMLFNQPIYSIAEKGKVLPLFSEMYISVPVLEETLSPGLSLTSNRWLFNDLTEDLDTVMLRVLSDPEEHSSKRFSINVNLSSLASPKFVKFDAELPADRRSGVVLEINKTDVMENMRLYRELCPFLRSRGYRILLDGLSFLNVAALDFSGIECDFAKVFWSSEITSLTADELERITVKVRRKDQPLFVLARCDAAESLRFARAVGITMVQGRLVDHMVKKNIPF